jgi:hypothetical protein
MTIWNCMSSKPLILMRTTTLSESTSSFPLFMALMIISIFIIPTSLPFCFWSHLLQPSALLSQSIGSSWKPIWFNNLSSCLPCLYYIDYPPQQSASILIPCGFIAHGFFSPNIPGCFVLEDEKLYLKGDICKLGEVLKKEDKLQSQFSDPASMA